MKQCWSGSELVEFRTLSGDEKQLSEQRTQRVVSGSVKSPINGILRCPLK